MMRKGSFLVFLFGLSLCSTGFVPQSPESWLSVMTFNIRYDNPGDGESAWVYRKDWVAEIIQESGAHVVGLQEALRHQIDSLLVRLPEYDWIGQGRSDGKDGGEFSPIFYRSSELDVKISGTFWLSPWPDSVGSVGWDAALPRIVTWALFEKKRSGEQFYHYNTHFDHRGEVARRESARLIRQKIQEIARGIPVVVTGDFNTTENDDPYRVLTSVTEAAPVLVDTKTVAPPESDLTTFRGFKTGRTDNRRIDFIFLSEHFVPASHTVIGESRNGFYPSDHLPVFVSFEKKAEK